MPTTHLFVELLVIGFGAFAWLLLLGAAVFGYDLGALDQRFLSLTALVPLLSIVYVLGIVVDRVADWVFDRLDARHRRQEYSGTEGDAYFKDRRRLVVHGPALWGHLEYGRSRLRICRGWALNAFLLMVATNAFAGVHRPATLEPCWRLLVANLVLGGFCGLCVACWWTLNRKEYRKIRRQSAWVKKMRKLEGGSDGRSAQRDEVQTRPGQVADAPGLPGGAESLEG